MSTTFTSAEQIHKKSHDINNTMKIEKVALEETGTFSPIFLDYLNEDEKLKKFFSDFPKPGNFQKVMESRSFPQKHRKVLVEALKEQYRSIDTPNPVKENIHKLLLENTFTITTGHQLNIFSGPLYFILKIITCILTAKALKKEYPEYHFVPVYWMASEDHDFAEINHFSLFGKTYTWETTQEGPVGRFDPNSLQSVLDGLPEKMPLFEKAYLQHSSLADATRYFVNELFGQEGLVVLDGDQKELKELFKPVVKEELLHNKAGKIIQETSSELTKAAYKGQVFPREINLFFMEQNLRERIVLEDNCYKVLNTERVFSEKEILQLLEDSPEKFSPNVVLRPVYQELILPNIAYIGGPAEVAYWLQLKQLFESLKVDFPVLMPRNFALIINKTLSKKVKKLNLPVKDLFLDLQALKNKFINENASNNISLEGEQHVLKQIYLSVLHKAMLIDQSLEGMVGAENTKALKGLENIEKRLRKAEEQNQETAIKQIENIKDKLFPGNGLQERTDNFLNFYLNNPSIIHQLLDIFDPFDFRFHVIIENE